MNANVAMVSKSLLPIPLYFAFGWLLQEYLSKYTIVGPVGSETGQPLFSSFSSMVFYGLIILMVIGLIYSAVQALKIKGWLRYLTIVVVLLFLPLQYLFSLAVEVSLFGK